MSFHNDRFLYLHYLKWRFESPPVEEQTAEHAVLIDPVAGVLAPRVHQQAAVAGYAELTVGHGRGVGRMLYSMKYCYLGDITSFCKENNGV